MADFLTLKILPVALALISHLLALLVKIPFFTSEWLEKLLNIKSQLSMSIFIQCVISLIYPSAFFCKQSIRLSLCYDLSLQNFIMVSLCRFAVLISMVFFLISKQRWKKKSWDSHTYIYPDWIVNNQPLGNKFINPIEECGVKLI